MHVHSDLRGKRRLVATTLALIAVACGVPAACDSSDSTTPPNGGGIDSGSTAPTAPTTTSTTPPLSDGGEAPKDDGAAPNQVFTGCRKLLAETPTTTSGVHAIDLDGTGPLAPLDVYCDMTFDGGGWTLIQSYTGAENPGSLPDSGTFDSGILGVATPQPNTFGALAGWVVKLLADKSSQVHIRYSFAADASAADPNTGVWVTSRPPTTNGPPTLPIQDLRKLVAMTVDGDGGFADWMGPRANAQTLGWGGNQCLPNAYPALYWACANPSAMGIAVFGGGGGKARWVWSNPSDDPIEVYVR